MHEDTHARLPLYRSDMTVNERDTLMVSMSAVIEGNTLDDARNADGRLAGEVLQGSWR